MICPVKWSRFIASCDHVTFASVVSLFYTFYITKITLQPVVSYRFICANNLRSIITNGRVQIAPLVFARKPYSILCRSFGCVPFYYSDNRLGIIQNVQTKHNSNRLVQSYFH